MAHALALTNEQLMKKAPSIFATQAWGEVSDKYAFIPTIDVVEKMRAEGFFPVRAEQSSCRTEGKQEFTKHMIRFRRAQDLDLSARLQAENPGHHFYARHAEIAPEMPEIVLVNSHDRTSGYQLEAGLFRFLCSNGLTVKSSDLGAVSVRHSGDVAGMVIDGCCRIIEDMPHVLEHVDTMKRVQLDPRERELFAAAALQLRYPDEEDGTKTAPIEPLDLLVPKRPADRKSDLWTTFNVVQENFIKGGVRGKGTTGKPMSTRAIKSVNEDLRMNKALWKLAEGMAQLKA